MTDPVAVYPTLPRGRLTPLSAPTTVPGPNVIGATGGSGTRVVARIIRQAGMFIGARRNAYEDALAFGEYSDRWINDFVQAPDDTVLRQMRKDLDAVVRDHLADLPEAAHAWGWKEPRSIYYVPLLHAVMPTLRFLHFVRDGRDMAFSENQNQLVKHGDAVLGEALRKTRTATRSIRVWSRVNAAAADYGEQVLRDRYLRVRFEDFCAQPVESVARIFQFFGLRADAEEAAAEVRPPDTLGRWQLRRKRVVDELHRTAERELARFGYL